MQRNTRTSQGKKQQEENEIDCKLLHKIQKKVYALDNIVLASVKEREKGMIFFSPCAILFFFFCCSTTAQEEWRREKKNWNCVRNISYVFPYCIVQQKGKNKAKTYLMSSLSLSLPLNPRCSLPESGMHTPCATLKLDIAVAHAITFTLYTLYACVTHTNCVFTIQFINKRT